MHGFGWSWRNIPKKFPQVWIPDMAGQGLGGRLYGSCGVARSLRFFAQLGSWRGFGVSLFEVGDICFVFFQGFWGGL